MLLTFRQRLRGNFMSTNGVIPTARKRATGKIRAVEKTCVLTAKQELSVTVTFAEALRKILGMLVSFQILKMIRFA